MGSPKFGVFLCLLCFKIVNSQFGFFNNQRDDRRYSPLGFIQNIIPETRRVTNRLTGFLHVEPQTPQSNPGLVYPFHNRPITNDRPYDQNRPANPNQYQNNQNQYDFNNNGQDPKNQNKPIEIYPEYIYQGTVLDATNGTQEGRDDDDTIIVVEEPGETKPINPVKFPENPTVVGNSDNGAPIETPDGNTVKFPDNKGPANENGNEELPPLTPVENNTPFGTISNNPQAFPAFNNNYGQSGGIPGFKPINEQALPLPPLTPDQSGNLEPVTDNSQALTSPSPVDMPTNLHPLTPANDRTSLPPLTPVPASEVRDSFGFGSSGLFQETCQTVEGGSGSCLNVYQCEPYVRLLQQSRSNPALVQVLRRAHCGFEGSNPKVCCPRPGIPTAPPTTTTITTVAPPAPSTPSTSDFIPAILSPPHCGVSNASFSRVVGGINAKLGDFPWMALLGYKSRRNQGTRWLCGGSLVSSKHVLTAAHCIHAHENDLYVVRLGELDLAREDEGATPVDVLIKDMIKHEDYSANSFANDIGLLVLDHDVTFTDLIKPICLPRTAELRSTTFEDYNPLIAGWGDTEFRGPSATHLQVLQLPVVSNDYCAQAYVSYKAQKIDERVLCAGFKQGGKDACQGDSGGPLMQPIWNNEDLSTHLYQIGVVSFGKKCAEAGFPGVYTRVTHFVPWLETKMLGQA